MRQPKPTHRKTQAPIVVTQTDRNRTFSYLNLMEPVLLPSFIGLSMCKKEQNIPISKNTLLPIIQIVWHCYYTILFNICKCFWGKLTHGHFYFFNDFYFPLKIPLNRSQYLNESSWGSNSFSESSISSCFSRSRCSCFVLYNLYTSISLSP